MNTFTIFAILAITAVYAEPFCTPGSFFKNDCNYCTCSSDGKTAACTDMACPKSLVASESGKFCQPGKTFQLDDCNACTCSRDGASARCTLQFCPSKKNEIASKTARFCSPGSVFSPDNCNKCICSKDGTKASCTLKMCENTINEIRNQKQVCQPFTTFKDYCNTCTCAKDGLSFGCTYMWCDKNIWNKDGSQKDVPEMGQDKINQKQVCQPHSTFNDYCNTCACSDDGLSYACTRMTCDKDIWNEDGSLKLMKVAVKSVERVCAPNTQFMEQCNTCICSNDGLSKMCTMMTCDGVNSKNDNLEVKSGQKQVCQPQSTFNDYCNTCSCSDDGLSYACTRMTCDKDIWNKDGSLKMMKVAAKSVERLCTPNTQFTEQCNTCICSNDGLSKMCTMMTCNKNDVHKGLSNIMKVRKIQSESYKVCNPGMVFSPDGCNTCICSNDGTQSACTLKLCLSSFKQAFKQNEEKEKWGPVYNQGDYCTPGKLFFSECNRCVCTKTGRSAICTLMECETRS